MNELKKKEAKDSSGNLKIKYQTYFHQKKLTNA